MAEIELTAGPLDYADTGGTGPCLVLLHGPLIGRTVWRKVVAELGPDFRCVVPSLPLGSHRRPMRPDAELGIAALADLVAEFLDRLDLTDVTLVINDWGGAQLIVERGRAERVARLVLTPCEAFDNFPPGPAKLMAKVVWIPGVVRLFAQLARTRLFRNDPRGYGGMSVRGVPDEVWDAWWAPLRRDRAIRRDFAHFAAGAPDRATLLAWSDRLRSFDRPVLVVWATEDRLMPREHGPRLAALFPQGRLVEIEDSSTLVPEDQPERLAEVLTEFLAETGAEPARG